MGLVALIFIAKILVGAACLVGAYYFMATGGFWLGLTGFMLGIVGIVALIGKVSIKT